MNSYILLRDNKESAPLSLQGLQQIGLKSNDLIWVECQSVSWRHPHEITELKMLVAAAANQPAAEETQQPAGDNSTAAETPVPATEEKRLVFIELPAEDPVPVKKQEVVIPFKGPALTDMHKYGGLTGSVNTAAAREIVPDINTKYACPPDEIKGISSGTREDRGQNKKNGAGIRLPKQLKQIAVYSGLVAAGALLMFLVTNPGRKRVNTEAPTSSQTAPNSQVISTVIPGEESADSIQPITVQETITAAENIPVPTDANHTVATKKIPGDTRAAEAAPDHQDESPVGKNAEAVSAAPAPKELPAENISSQLSVNNNNYITGAFGGIRNLEMTLQNGSKYLLDKVTVEVKYLNLDGNTVHTEHLQFQSVQPGKTETIPVKKTRRGVKISYKITKIESREVNSSTAGL